MWTLLDGQHWNQIDYICSQRWRSSIQSAKTRPGIDCGSDYVLLIAKFRLKLKKVGKRTRPFGYDVSHIPYDYTVEVTNRFKGLHLIARVPQEQWMEVSNIVQEAGIKPFQIKRNLQEGKMVVWGDLTNSWEKKRKAEEKGKDMPIWMDSSKEKQGEIRKPSLCKETEENNWMRKTRDLFKKVRDTKISFPFTYYNRA